jgi:Cys-rich protein (TIGR01571 family)
MTDLEKNVATDDLATYNLEYATTGRWRDSIFDCCNQVVPSLTMSLCCACVMTGQICRKIKCFPCWSIGILMAIFAFFSLVASSKAGHIYPFIAVYMFFGVVACISRYKIRSILSIPGNLCTDCLYACFCTALTNAQVRNIL